MFQVSQDLVRALFLVWETVLPSQGPSSEEVLIASSEVKFPVQLPWGLRLQQCAWVWKDAFSSQPGLYLEGSIGQL